MDDLRNFAKNLSTSGLQQVQPTPSSTPEKSYKDFDIDRLADAIIEGTYGNGENRQRNLTNRGFNYHQVQDFVNKKLAGTLTPEDYTHDFMVNVPDMEDPYEHFRKKGDTDQIPTDTQWFEETELVPNAELYSAPRRTRYGRHSGVISPEELVDYLESLRKPYYPKLTSPMYTPNHLYDSTTAQLR